MFSYQHQVRVRFGDTDKMGYVYYGNYAYYYEQARAEAIRSTGISYKQIEDTGVIMPVTRMSVKYAKPAFYDDLLTITAYIEEMPGRVITWRYEIRNQHNELLNEGDTSLVFVKVADNKPTRAPRLLTDKLEPFFEMKSDE
jgi:acyl-CoA thioester hydrolase